jgi:hypothetical protein
MDFSKKTLSPIRYRPWQAEHPLIFQQELDSRKDENPAGFRHRQGHSAVNP